VNPVQAQPAVGAILVHPDGRVLVVQRGQPPFLGEWTILGGKVRPGEAEDECARREALEETALRVDVLERLAVLRLEGEGFLYQVHEMLCMPKDPSATPIAGDDAAAVRWARLEELEGLGVREDARALFASAVERLRGRGLLW
jgi:ADP-ribose pyrophosphatase YjhB (NUDIX family)